MTDGDYDLRLVWITKSYAINPASIVMVFHGNGGEVQITLTGHEKHSTHENDLTDEGRALLLPPGAVVQRPRLSHAVSAAS
jgi:hypothetical protein